MRGCGVLRATVGRWRPSLRTRPGVEPALEGWLTGTAGDKGARAALQNGAAARAAMNCNALKEAADAAKAAGGRPKDVVKAVGEAAAVLCEETHGDDKPKYLPDDVGEAVDTLCSVVGILDEFARIQATIQGMCMYIVLPSDSKGLGVNSV